MPSLHFTSVFLAVIACCAVTFLRPASALETALCSSINTSSNQQNSSIYQSEGLCYDFCKLNYAFAIVQSAECWCSDYVPATTVLTSNCDFTCPGYPTDRCGGEGLYGYIALPKAAVGTKAAGVSQTSAAQSSQRTPSTTSSSSSMTWTPTPVVSVVTVTGQVQTITYTPTSPPSSANQSGLSKGSNSLNTGQAVGLTFGLVALVILISAIIFFCVRKRNKQKRREAEIEAAASAFSRRGSSSQIGGAPTRTMSENSRFMLQTDGRQVVEGWESNDSGTPGSRVSRLLPVDPRLDPYAGVYQRGDGSKSRESVQTIQDNHDYSRRVLGQGPILRATNPD